MKIRNNSFGSSLLSSLLALPLLTISLLGCHQTANHGAQNLGSSEDRESKTGTHPALAFINAPVTMTSAECSKAMTVQLQDGSGKAIPGSQNKSTVSLTLGFSLNIISGIYGAPIAYSDAACTVPLLPTESSPKGNVPNGGYEGTGIASIPAGWNSVNVYMIPKTSVFMNLIAADQAAVYASGSQIEPVLAGSPQIVMLSGPDTIGTKAGVCSHPFYARTLDQYSNPANVTNSVKLQLAGLGSASVYSDSACTKILANNEIILKNSSTIWGTDGGPSSDVPFYILDTKSENLSVTASVLSGGLPFAYGVDLWTTPLADPGQPPIPPQSKVTLMARPSSVACGASGVVCVHDTGNAEANGANLQSAINSSQPGTVIVLDAGKIYEASLVLPQGISKNPDGKYITITTSKLASLPAPGTRVGPSNLANMATIQADPSNPDYAITTTTGTTGVLPSSYFRFIGLEITISSTTTLQYLIMNLESGPSSKDTPAQQSDLPNHIFVESSYVHGNAIANVEAGISLGGVYEAVVDSYVSDCHYVGEDAQAINGRGGATLLIQNNYLEGSGENIIYGGAPAFFPNSITSDLSILHNTFNKPITWYDNRKTDPNSQFVCVVTPSNPCAHWTVKNILEFKEGRRVLVEGNTFTNCWVDGQTGFPLLITPQGDGLNYFIIVEDVTYTNNILKHSMNGLNFSPESPIAPAHSQLTQRVLFQNNAAWDIGGSFWGPYTNSALLESQGFDSLTIDHNTMGFSNTGQFWDTSPAQIPPNGISITNNIATGGNTCFHASPPGWAGFDNLVINNNAFIGCSSKQMPPQATNTFFPTDPTAVGFTDWKSDAWNNDTDVLSLKTSSSYYKDGLGVDWPTLISETK